MVGNKAAIMQEIMAELDHDAFADAWKACGAASC